MNYKPNLKNLVEIRKAKGISIAEMAEKLGITSNTYLLKEKGKLSFKLQEARKIAKMFGLTIDELFYSIVCRVI
jgi:putative transcriptional regulator